MQKIQITRGIVQIIYISLFFTAFFTKFTSFSITLLIIMIFSGVYFCGWLCPFGTLQEIINNIRNIFTKKKITPSQNTQKYLIYTRYILYLLLFLGVTSLFIYDAKAGFLSHISGNIVAIPMTVSIVIFSIFSIFMDRPFCNYFCPEGAKYGLYSILRIFSIKRNKKTCTNCKICNSSCPMYINVSNTTYNRSPQCINCFKCISSCPKKSTLKYNIIDKKELLHIQNETNNSIRKLIKK